jgi:hypothetical protein
LRQLLSSGCQEEIILPDKSTKYPQMMARRLKSKLNEDRTLNFQLANIADASRLGVGAAPRHDSYEATHDKASESCVDQPSLMIDQEAGLKKLCHVRTNPQSPNVLFASF